MSLLRKNMHSGEVLAELYLAPLRFSPSALARHIGIPERHIEQLICREASMMPDTAVRLAKAFTTTPAYWMTMQVNHDLSMIDESIDLTSIKPLIADLQT